MYNFNRLTIGMLLAWLVGLGQIGSVYAQHLAYAEGAASTQLITNPDDLLLSSVLEDIESRKQVRFVYETRIVKGKRLDAPVNLERETESILRDILSPLGLDYKKMKYETYTIFQPKLNKRQRAGNALQRVAVVAASRAQEDLEEAETSPRASMTINTIHPERVRFEAVEHVVSGTITDDRTGDPLVGATVRSKEYMSRGTLTDGEGRFSLTLPDGNGILIVSYVGYASQEIAINGRNEINLSLKESAASLDEVVVTGYGSQVKREVTGSIASIKGDDIVKIPMTSADQGLQGMAAGVQVASANGVAGAPVRVMVRGTNSISAGTEPLWIIDGMPVSNNITGYIRSTGNTAQNPLANINPNDIESIEVLKDAAATAIYGSRGSNGVIIITTKNGTQGRGEFNLSYQTGVTQVTRHPDEIMLSNGDDWLNVINQARENSGLSPWDPQNGVREDLYGQNEESFTLTEAQARAATAQYDEILNSGSFHDINVSTARGFEGGNYYISANYRDEKGVLWNEALDAGNRFQRLATRINADLKPFDSFTMGTRTTLSYTNNRRVSPNGGGGPGGNSNIATPGLGAVTGARPIYPIFTPDGELFDPRSGNNLRATMDPANYRNQYYGYRVLTNLFVQWDLPWIPGLSIRSEAAADILLNHGIEWGNTVIREGSAYAFDAQSTVFNYNVNAYATYTRDIGDHGITLTLGTEQQTSSTRSKNIEGEELIGTAQEIGNPGVPLRFGGGFNTNRNILSYFGRVNYNFGGRFLATVNFRADAATPFLEEGERVVDDTWGYFPAVSFGWILSEESFMQDISLVNFLKLRASFGRTGNWNIPSGLDLVGFTGWGRYGSRDLGVNAGDLLTNIPAQGITWETTDSWDAGIDFELLNSRVSGNIAYFLQDVSGLIIQVPVPPSSGIFNGGSIWANVGEMRNQGLEVSFTSYNIDTRDFRWETSFNFTYNTNEVLSLNPTLDENENGINAGITTTVAGGMLGEFFLARYAGLNEFGGYPMIYEVDRNQTLSDGTPNPNFGEETGNIIAADRNAVRNHKQRTGKSGLPTYFGGLNNTLTYKGLELNFQFVFQGGNYIFDDNARNRSRVGGGGALLADMLTDTWTPDNKDATYPLLTWNNRYDTYNEDGTIDRTNQRFDYRGNQYYDQFLQRGDFLRLRTLQLAYNFPRAALDKLNLRNLRVFVTGTNLLTITGYDGLDPEQAILSGNRNLTQGVFGLNLPPLRMFTAGVNLQF